MAGPLIIQRFPLGLLDIFGMQSSGDTPTQLNEQVSGVLELGRMYMLPRGENRQAVVTGVANGTPAVVPLIVPVGEAWVLWNVSARVNSLAAGSITVQPCIVRSRNPAGGAAGLFALAPPEAIAAANEAVAPSWNGLEVLLPGDGITVNVVRSSAAQNISLSAFLTVLKV